MSNYHNYQSWHYQDLKGFTLIEALVTIAIIAIVMSMAYPTMKTIIYKMEAERIKRTFITTINLAKATSYTHHKSVTMCLINTAGQCHKDGNQHLMLFFDNNDSKNYEPKIDTLIDTNELNLKYATTYGRMGRRHYVRFASDTGIPRGFFGHFKYCPLHADNENIYQVSFNNVGIYRVKPNKNHPTGCPH